MRHARFARKDKKSIGEQYRVASMRCIQRCPTVQLYFLLFLDGHNSTFNNKSVRDGMLRMKESSKTTTKIKVKLASFRQSKTYDTQAVGPTLLFTREKQKQKTLTVIDCELLDAVHERRSIEMIDDR
jgi:hypothetical protein